MKLTNKFNYPETIVKAIRNDTYDKGDSEFSATGLIQPPRIAMLTRLHQDEIEMDVDDEMFKLYGHLGHAILERAGTGIVEKRLFTEIDGVKISAQIDSLSLEDGILTDWKFTTVWGFKKDKEPKWEWVAQMNIQLELLRRNGMDANRMQIVGLLRDWRPGEAKKEKGYPPKVGVHEIEMKSREHTVEFIRKRIKEHRQTELPECSSHDHWSWRRCQGYCNVSKYCDQYKNKGEK